MAKLNRIETTLPAVNGGQELAVLTGKRASYPYTDGKRGETPDGNTFDIAMQGNRLTALSVKVLGVDPLPNVTDEAISEAVAAGQFPYVRFADCKISVYTMQNEMRMSATATSVELVEPRKKSQQ